MATLVLSTVGTVLGGPAGSAIGALIGQSIDQELLAPPRRGPRVGDLGVQTSSYGTQIPRIYGMMRVAGSVIWSTELVEHEQLGGAKGQPDVAYGYSVSMAVALSSRAAKNVGRIWADGKLLRGAAGDFKVATKFRFYGGSDDQIVDALIASVEGVGSAPAYRGLAIAVFEDLELAEFGNRIPFLTFEIAADDQAVALGDILSDATMANVQCDLDRTVDGFAAYGSSIGNAIAPLVESFGIELVERGTVIGCARSDAPAIVDADELGCSAGDKAEPRLEREQVSDRSLPATLRVSYYDPARDYQTGEARASAGEVSGADVQRDLPVVMAAGDAKALTQEMLARAWRGRETMTLRLPPARLGLEPGDKLQLPDDGSIWTVRTIVIDGFVVTAELQLTGHRAPAVLADPGRLAGNPDIEAGPLNLALLDIRNLFGPASNQPTLMLAASRTGGWNRRPVEIRVNDQSFAAATPRVKSVLGVASTALAAGATELIDRLHSVEVQLVDPDHWLVSCDDDGLAAGANLAVVGKELLQFGEAIALGSGRFRLRRFLRGRGGTEWACEAHSAGETFCLVQAGSLEQIGLPLSALGASVSSMAGDTSTSIQFEGQAVQPLSPVRLSATRRSTGELDICWTRRSRQGFAWLDGLETPLGETEEQYRVVVTGSASSYDAAVTQPLLTLSAATVMSLGLGATAIQVRQVGDVAVSLPVQIEITLS